MTRASLVTVWRATLGALAIFATLTECSRLPPSSPGPLPQPQPTPPPVAAAIRFLGGTLPEGSTVAVSPMFASGQQAQQLSFSAAITLDRDLSNALVRAWVETSTIRCMGGGILGVSFQNGREKVVSPASMSNPGPAGGQAVCPLPYDTSIVEIEVLEGETPVIQRQFPAAYHFVSAT
jgi:hypothetical protein